MGILTWTGLYKYLPFISFHVFKREHTIPGSIYSVMNTKHKKINEY